MFALFYKLERKGMLETERLYLRRYKEKDLDDFYEYIGDEQVVKYEPYNPLNRREAAKELQERIRSKEYIAVELKLNRKMIGNLYVAEREYKGVEIGYVFNKNYWAKGYAKEAADCIIQDVFRTGVHRVYAKCDPNNVPSWKLLESLNFQREGHLKKNIYVQTDKSGQPVWRDTYIYAKLNPNVIPN
jgi:RimJ/RimL family protein N-acetyltransferase